MNAASFSRRLHPAYKAVCRMVGYALHLGCGTDLKPYQGLAMVLRAKLTPSERQGLAWAALMACDDAEAEGIAASVLGEGTGVPLPAFLDVAEDAALWAAYASPRELRAYSAACETRLMLTRRRMVA